jgi:hypothetical protein
MLLGRRSPPFRGRGHDANIPIISFRFPNFPENEVLAFCEAASVYYVVLVRFPMALNRTLALGVIQKRVGEPIESYLD